MKTTPKSPLPLDPGEGFLEGRTLVSARIRKWMECLFLIVYRRTGRATNSLGQSLFIMIRACHLTGGFHVTVPEF